MKILNEMKDLSNVSRRNFLKGTAALSASAALYGCSKDEGETDYIFIPTSTDDPLKPDAIYPGTGGHNCGGARCLTVAHVKNGKIVRIVSDEINDARGTYQNPESYNNAQSIACTKCRSYKFRLYHPGRLKYPLKQTRKRGDLSGFVRVSWDSALNDIARKHKATIEAYGPESIHNLYACGSYSGGLQGGGFNGVYAGNNANSIPMNMLGGYSNYFSHYSFHQQSFFGTSYTGYGSMAPTSLCDANAIAGVVNTAVLWGSNTMTTQNNQANAQIHAYREMRKRPGTQILFIGPEFVDHGVNCATEWIQMRPYTDSALVLGMMHEMIVNTFKEDGTIYSADSTTGRPYLNVDYLDAVVYGFFDSPKYWVVKESGGAIPQGTIVTDSASATVDYTMINAVPAGRSLSAYIMGTDIRLTKARYDAGNSYIAQKFAAGQTFRNGSACSYTIGGTTANTISGTPTTNYLRKKDYMTIKNPKWAEGITGVPEEKIKALAKLYCTPSAHPIYNEWCGAQQKQAEGIINAFFSIQTLLIVTQTYGRTGETHGRNNFGPATTSGSGREELPNYATIDRGTVPTKPTTPVLSCTMWYNAIRFALGDEMAAGGYTGKFIPDAAAPATGTVYHDDGGTKALVKVKRNGGSIDEREVNGYKYYDWETKNGKPVYSGFRFIMNSGGNILLNQHMNPNDTAEMFASLPVCTADPSNADSLCIVSFDNFMSPTPRWSDYVLPAATNWEQDNRIQLSMGPTIIIPQVSTPPGESKSTYNFTVAFLQAYEGVEPSKAGVAAQYVGHSAGGTTIYDPSKGVVDQYYDKWKRSYENSGKPNDPTSRYYGKTFDEALQIQYQPYATGAMSKTTTVTPSTVRTNIDTYLNLADATRRNTPFLPVTNNSTGAVIATGGSSHGADYPTPTQGGTYYVAPEQSGRAHVYCELLPWQYERRFAKWHGYLAEQGKPVGQNNTDAEGDPIMLPIPMYFAYEDYFMEAYKNQLPSSPLCLTTTHDRHRPHSSQAETPLVRELTTRTRGGKLYSGNDWGTYALITPFDADNVADGASGTIPRLNKSIADKDYTKASWQEIWLNDEDAEARGINDGDIVLVKNVIGSVRCAARVSTRCVKGFAGLHQGAWYDPDPMDNVDDGGCANTLMATKPSRGDHGNGQQSAMVEITKVVW